MTPRSAGLLLHITSLPGPYGIGDLGPEAETFLDWAAAAGQGIWQILPVHPTGGNDSPYGGVSAFAGNPLLLSPRRLVEDGLLSEGAQAEGPRFDSDRVDYARVRRWKEGLLLRESWSQFQRQGASAREELEAFRAAPAQAAWLEDWILFAALKERLGGRPWPLWPDGLAAREPKAIAAARRNLAGEILFHAYVQFLFARQWERLHASARAKGIALFGDVPIYVTHDSADVWAHPDLFALDAAGWPEMVAGVPPDYFSETGQLWGYPLYRWDAMEAEGFRWWIDRLRNCLSAVEIVRIDHFRGLAGYWAVPAGDRDARGGKWLKGPGEKLFDALRRELGSLPIVANVVGVPGDQSVRSAPEKEGQIEGKTSTQQAAGQAAAEGAGMGALHGIKDKNAKEALEGAAQSALAAYLMEAGRGHELTLGKGEKLEIELQRALYLLKE